MRHLVWYFMSAFCSHDWNREEEFVTINNNYGSATKKGIKVSATCKKCGWYRKYWKFL